MFRIETTFAERREAERFKTAFYRFLETYPPPIDEAAWLEAQIMADGEHQAAVLWSKEAADAFKSYAANFQTAGHRPARFPRFDDLHL